MCLSFVMVYLRDATHTHFVALFGKWTIVGAWVKHRADKRGKEGVIKLPKTLAQQN